MLGFIAYPVLSVFYYSLQNYNPTKPWRNGFAGLDNFTQAIANRLKTRQGELASLGHPDYGSRHHELIGEPNVPRVRNLIKLYVLQALRDEPRVERVLRADVLPEHDPPRDSVRIELQVQVLGAPTPLNLVVPFSLGVGV